LRNLRETPTDFLGPITQVVDAALAVADGLGCGDIMVVGAWCRDVLHHALGHTFPAATTS
jgi:hypothetical protein